MEYETPKIDVLAPAIDAIQGASKQNSGTDGPKDSPAAYQDWE